MKIQIQITCPECGAILDVAHTTPESTNLWASTVKCDKSSVKPSEMQNLGCGHVISVGFMVRTFDGAMRDIEFVDESPKIGDLFTIDEFVGMAERGSVIDWDGSGVFATATQYSDVPVVCSIFAEGKFTTNTFTHVLWFNK